MPKVVDHDQRRRQIAEAVWRLASSVGLEDVTLRKVASEAGVSMRLVQYYFGTRQELLIGALEILNADSEAVAAGALTSDDSPDPVALLRDVLLQLLPLDDRRRTRHLVQVAYFVRSLHDADLAGTFAGADPALETLVAALIGQVRGESQRDRADAEGLLALVDGVATRLLLRQHDAERALAMVDHQLALVLGD